MDSEVTRFDLYESVVYKGEAISAIPFDDQPTMWLLCHDALHDDNIDQIRNTINDSRRR